MYSRDQLIKWLGRVESSEEFGTPEDVRIISQIKKIVLSDNMAPEKLDSLVNNTTPGGVDGIGMEEQVKVDVGIGYLCLNETAP